MRAGLLFLAFWMFSLRAIGQQADSLEGTLTVTTDPPGAELNIDSLSIGRTPVDTIGLPQGRHVLAISYPSATEWNGLRVTDTLLLNSEEHVKKHYIMGVLARIETVPPGAVVVQGDSAFGLTPYTVRLPRVSSAEVSLRADGYSDTVLTLHPTDQTMRILLRAADKNSAGGRMTRSGLAQDESSVKTWMPYAAAVSAVGFGIVTAYLKHEANRNFDLYIATNDPRYQNLTRKYDKAAAWTLVISEVSFGLFAYLLLAD